MTSTEAPQWRRNLLVCSLGSFTTIIGMTLILPILPLYIRNLGVSEDSAITAWSGVAYAATFLTAALSAPVWGRLGDRFGRKPMLLRASLGMAIAMPLMGIAHDVWQLVFFRFIAGLLGGYASGATILIAAQAPKNRTAWALGVLSSAVMAGSVAGPLLGGVLAEMISIPTAFLVTGVLIFLAFLATAFFVREPDQPPTREFGAATAPEKIPPPSSTVPHRLASSSAGGLSIPSLLGLSALLMFAVVSVEPIITVHIENLTGTTNGVALSAAIVFSLTAAGSIISAPLLGAIADRTGTLRVLSISLMAATLLIALQIFATELWVFALLRFLTGLALGGVTPAIVSMLRRMVPADRIGQVLGLNVSAQYVGQVTGPVLAGFLSSATGTGSVFLLTTVLTGIGAAVCLCYRPTPGPR